MAHYQATVDSQRSAVDTFHYLATFSNAAQWDPGVLAGEQPTRPGFRAVGDRATAGLARALSAVPTAEQGS
jgi:hypothetical protein